MGQCVGVPAAAAAAGAVACRGRSDRLMEHLWATLLNWAMRLDAVSTPSLYDCFGQLVRFSSAHVAQDAFFNLVTQPWNYYVLLHAIQAIDSSAVDPLEDDSSTVTTIAAAGAATSARPATADAANRATAPGNRVTGLATDTGTSVAATGAATAAAATAAAATAAAEAVIVAAARQIIHHSRRLQTFGIYLILFYFSIWHFAYFFVFPLSKKIDYLLLFWMFDLFPSIFQSPLSFSFDLFISALIPPAVSVLGFGLPPIATLPFGLFNDLLTSSSLTVFHFYHRLEFQYR